MHTLFSLFQPCHHLLNYPKETILKETCWMLSNITAGTVDQIQAVIESKLIPSILNVLYQVTDKLMCVLTLWHN